MASSSPALRMVLFACTRSRHAASTRCSQDARYQSETSHCRQMETGLQLPASKYRSPSEKMCSLSNHSETTIKVVDTGDMTRVLYIRDLPKPAKHISFHPSGAYLAVSCTDGVIYIYSMSTEEPELVRRVDGVIRSLEADVEISARAIWHPDGRAFGAPTATREIQVISRNDGERQRSFSGGHMGDITALAWSPNGALLASAGTDRKILLWETKSQKILARYNLYIGPGMGNFANENIDTTTRILAT